MIICSDIADYEWLIGEEGYAVLQELGATDVPLHTIVSRLRKRLSPSRVHLLIEQVELRRRAASKFSAAHRMFLTRTGLEQATDEWVARYKANRFRQARCLSTTHDTVADLCCGIGGDLSALAEQGRAVGVDRDPVAALFAAVNTGAEVHLADVAVWDPEGFAAWHIDPDRRPCGRRTTSLDFCRPQRLVIEKLLQQLPHAAIKLAPATIVPAEWAEQCELEWISRNNHCRQLVAWHGDLAQTQGTRRATMLSTNGGLVIRSVRGLPDLPIPVADKPDRFIFDIDSAVLAAKLKGAVAAEHRLRALADGPTYLTGPCHVADAAFACFEVCDVIPLKVRVLTNYLRMRGIGQLEIKKRGVDVDPQILRRKLKLRGNGSATLLITSIGGRSAAIVANRLS